MAKQYAGRIDVKSDQGIQSHIYADSAQRVDGRWMVGGDYTEGAESKTFFVALKRQGFYAWHQVNGAVATFIGDWMTDEELELAGLLEAAA